MRSARSTESRSGALGLSLERDGNEYGATVNLTAPNLLPAVAGAA